MTETHRPSRLPETAPTARPLHVLYFTRACIAVVWAGTLTAFVHHEAAVIALLIFYPLLDVAASLVDARIHRGTMMARTQLGNAVVSGVAVAAIAITASSLTHMVAVFGGWALLSGAVQLYVAVRRRRLLGGQWAMIVSGSLSTLGGLMFLAEAMHANPDLKTLARYSLAGVFFYIVSAVRLRRGTPAAARRV